MRNIFGSTLSRFRLTVGTPMKGNVAFIVQSNAGILHTGMITSGTPAVVMIPGEHQVTDSNFGNRLKGIHVFSPEGGLLYVVAENFITFLNHGTYIAYPCLSLGENVEQYEYGVISFDDPADNLGSQFLLVGCSNDTVLTITPTQSLSLPMDIQRSSSTVNIDSGTASNEIILHQMQTLLVSSLDDLTGTIITSNKPLVVISGHECANIPLSATGCEPFAVQVLPITTWGTEFLLSPFFGRDGPQGFKAVSSKSNTSYVYRCSSDSRLAVQTRTVSFFSASYCHLQSTDPAFLVALSFGGSIDSKGDPSISIVSPVDQYVKTVDFVSLPTRDFPTNYISVTVEAKHFNPQNILLDGEEINCTWHMINDTKSNIVGYGCNKTINSDRSRPRKHNVTHSAEDGALSVIVYGFSSFPALGYSYLGGQILKITEG